MSWFRHRPIPKNPPVHTPKDFSPATQRSLDEAKKSGPTKLPDKKGS